MAQNGARQNLPALDAALDVARGPGVREVRDVTEAAVASGDGGEEQEASEDDTLQDPVNDPSLANFKEISNLASWTVSSYKPGCGVEALRDPTTATFWQSDGPQPHLLNIHFSKMVRIVKLRVYLDFELDESYTPTRMLFLAGSHVYDLIDFAEWRWQDNGPRGWIDIDLSMCGNERVNEELVHALAIAPDDPEYEAKTKGLGVLRCWFLQIRVLENHQNGKDTHIRGVQVFALDEDAKKKAETAAAAANVSAAAEAVTTAAARTRHDDLEARINALTAGMEAADFMGDPVIR